MQTVNTYITLTLEIPSVCSPGFPRKSVFNTDPRGRTCPRPPGTNIPTIPWQPWDRSRFHEGNPNIGTSPHHGDDKGRLTVPSPSEPEIHILRYMTYINR